MSIFVSVDLDFFNSVNYKAVLSSMLCSLSGSVKNLSLLANHLPRQVFQRPAPKKGDWIWNYDEHDDLGEYRGTEHIGNWAAFYLARGVNLHWLTTASRVRCDQSLAGHSRSENIKTIVSEDGEGFALPDTGKVVHAAFFVSRPYLENDQCDTTYDIGAELVSKLLFYCERWKLTVNHRHPTKGWTYDDVHSLLLQGEK